MEVQKKTHMEIIMRIFPQLDSGQGQIHKLRLTLKMLICLFMKEKPKNL